MPRPELAYRSIHIQRKGVVDRYATLANSSYKRYSSVAKALG